MIKDENNVILEKNYLIDLQTIKDTIKKAQYRAMVKVNTEMILTYYKIGKIINQNKSWGNKYIERLSQDLKEYGTGYSRSNLFYMKQFSDVITKEEFIQHPVGQLTWSSIIIIMQKSSSHDELLWYINESAKNGLSRALLINEYKMKAYERSLIKPTTSLNVSISKESNLTDDLFKNSYVFDFIDRNKIKSERDLELSLVNNISKFILELGEGFAFVGRQYHLEVSNNDYYIDLLFYNIKIHSYIVIELKLGEFKPDYVGQLIFYVNTVNHNLKSKEDNPTIGLLLCSEADKLIAINTLEGTKLPLGVSKYKFIEELPEYLENRLKKKRVSVLANLPIPYSCREISSQPVNQIP